MEDQDELRWAEWLLLQADWRDAADCKAPSVLVDSFPSHSFSSARIARHEAPSDQRQLRIFRAYSFGNSQSQRYSRQPAGPWTRTAAR
jgi:hypothetical protein